MSQNLSSAIAVIGIDIGKNSFHVVGLDAARCDRAASEVVARPVEARFANMPPCLIGMEACVGAHHLSRKLKAFGHDARLMPAKYVRPYSKGQKNDFRDAEAIAEAVQRPTMKFVATKTAEQLDLQALHRVRERLVSQRTGIINQIRAFLLERGIAVRQGLRFLRAELPRLLATPPDVLSPRMVGVIEGLAEDWRRLDERIEHLSGEITALARQDAGCERLVSVPGIGPIISSAMVAAIGTGEAFSKGRDFAAWLGTSAEPGGEVTAFGERISIADRGHHGAGDDRSDAGNAHQPLAPGVLPRKGRDLVRQVIDTLIKPAPVFGQTFNDVYHAGRQHIGRCSENARQLSAQEPQALPNGNATLQ